MVAQLEHHHQQDSPAASFSSSLEDRVQKTKSLISALNFVSRNLPLPLDLFNTVSSIYSDVGNADFDGGAQERSQLLLEYGFNITQQGNPGISIRTDLMTGFGDALSKQRLNCMSGFSLAELSENRYQSHILHRLNELEDNPRKGFIDEFLCVGSELPSTRGEDLQMKCLLELHGLKLAELQSKVQSEVSSEYWLRLNCMFPDKQLFDWGMMRLPRPLYGIGDAFAMEADDQFRKKRDAERLSRLEGEERNHVETRKRKFFAEILNAVREFQLQIQATHKRRKQRNDGIQAWHGRQRQRATRAEKLRLQALKADDQEAYMRLVKESKNERLTMLLEETNKLLANLGAAVKRQKDSKHSDGIEPLRDSEADSPELDASRNESELDTYPEEDVIIDSNLNDDTGDLLEGQRQYDSAIHSIQEKVTEQPYILKGGQLRSYQLEGLQWMLSLFNNNLNGILADEMGLGKTIQTISLIAYLKEKKGVCGPHLIVAPKAVLPNWINEFSTWISEAEIKAFLYDGCLEERKAIREQLSREGNLQVLITHYDLIMRDKAFLKKIQWQYMIVDEGHRLKNHECALAKTIGGYQMKRRLLLTGTPIQNSLQELWSLLNFLLPHIFNSEDKFEEWFNAPFADRGEVSLTDEEQLLIIRRLHNVIRPFILRRKKNEVEKYLPGKTQVLLKCDLSAWQKVYYQQVTEMGRVGLHTGSGKSKSLQNLTMQLRKCCNHPYLFVGDYNMWRKDEIMRASGKFELLDRLLPKLHATDHRVLLFSQMTRLMDILEIYLQLHDYKYLRLDGSTKTEERGTLLKKFNAPDSPYFMFLLSTRAGGLGLNLQTADTVIIFDSDWNPQMDQQAEDRAHRIGQKKEVRVFVLVSVGSVEEVILERAKQKKGIDAKVIQAGLFNTTSTAQDRKDMLEEIMHRGTSSLGTDVPSEREINRLAARSQEEFRIFEDMDKDRRKKEDYRSRLMEEHEVPEWAYQAPDNKEDKAKGFEQNSTGVLGKRRRKEVIYSDTLSDLQWIKAVENGEDMSKLSSKGKKQEHTRSEANDSASNSARTDKKVLEMRNEYTPVASEGTSEDNYASAPQRPKSDEAVSQKPDYQGSEKSEQVGGESGLNKHIFTWNTYKKKRSSYVVPSSSTNSRGQNSNGKGNGWA
ncbi:ATP-dependent DNA helicase CHR12 isoform X1 [Populus alba x Populus x berolinensis]|uniref:DNA helicase n=2 Tax=Populus TaxID=3689 RepID=A0AAD6MB28_9ROSI|nr:ATP-dependent DNA helicase CHR12 isoform X1 [Populus alba x Populus x berolinensis]